METADLLRDKLSEDCRKAYTEEAEENNFYNVYDKLFEYIWTAPLFHASDAEKLKSFIERQEADEQAFAHQCRHAEHTTIFSTRKKYRLVASFLPDGAYESPRTGHDSCRVDLHAIRKTICLLSRPLGRTIIVSARRTPKRGTHPPATAIPAQPETAKAERKLQNEIFPDLLRSRNYQRNKMGFEQMEEDFGKKPYAANRMRNGKSYGSNKTVGRQHESHHRHG